MAEEGKKDQSKEVPNCCILKVLFHTCDEVRHLRAGNSGTLTHQKRKRIILEIGKMGTKAFLSIIDLLSIKEYLKFKLYTIIIQ